MNKAYADDASNRSTIGGISVDKLSLEELKVILNDAIINWTSEPIIVSGGGSSLKINPTALQFDVEATIATYESMTKKDWFAFWESKRVVHLPLELAPSDSIKKEIESIAMWHTDSTYDKVFAQAAYLGSHEVEADVANLTLLENDRIALDIEQIPEEAMGVSELVNALNEQIINPNEPFSLLEKLSAQADLANREALNFVASMLYSVALNTNSEIMERSSQNVVPSYLTAGIEAAVERDGSQDLRFLNTTSNAMKLKLSIEGDNLKVEAYTTNKEQDIEVRVVRDRDVEPRIITRYTNDLAIGQQQLVEEGAPGLRVSVYRYSSATGVEELISKDYYAPKNRIILKSSSQPVTATSNAGGTTSSGNASPSIDLDGDGLPDYEEGTSIGGLVEPPLEDEQLPAGSYYDKGGNLITP
ncbi:VanW family protein [Solibacillus sp. CAU 1738]|uniref:VanW family protein n=1 Tax=Solibacillus sp. CAU 1738 TaxID=3140363 RepID=UPI003260015A